MGETFNIGNFSALETVGCDGHHIKTDPAGNRAQGESCGGAMKASPQYPPITFT